MSKRFFINNVDTLVGSQIIKELTPGEDELEPVHMATYFDDSRLDKGRGVKKILKRAKPKLSRKKMLEEIDVYVYDLHFCDPKDVRYAVSIFDNVQLEEQKTFILISDVAVWGKTPRKIKTKAQEQKEGEGGEEGQQEEKQEEEQEKNEEQENQKGEDEQNLDENNENGEGQNSSQQKEDIEVIEYAPFEEKDFELREPLDRYKQWKSLEKLVLSLNGKENLKVIIIASGVLYGHGEVTFQNMFKYTWLQDPAYFNSEWASDLDKKGLPYIGDGNNLIPTIHISDLASFVVKVAENPPEGNYLFAFDNSNLKTQKSIVESISKNFGNGRIFSIERDSIQKDDRFIPDELVDIFLLDLDMKNSEILQGTEENPSTFEWKFEKGFQDSKKCKEIFAEFTKKFNLRPLKIIVDTLYNEKERKTYNYNRTIKEISLHYKIPIIGVQDVFDILKRQINNEPGISDAIWNDQLLVGDVKEEWEKIQNYINEKAPRNIDETLKVFYRALKWRLSLNDCRNRGYILDCFPTNTEEIKWIFFPVKPKKLERVRPKPKKEKKKKVKQNAEESQQQQNDSQQKENNGDDEPQEDENQEQGGEDEENQEPNENLQQENKPQEVEEESAEEPEEQVPEEEQQEQAEEEEAEGEEAKPKLEEFYPESFIFVKKYGKTNPQRLLDGYKPTEKEILFEKKSQVTDFFSAGGIEIQMIDIEKKDEFEIFESLRIYLERKGRPFNYLQPEEQLFDQHNKYYEKRDLEVKQVKEIQQKEQNAKKNEIKLQREKICQDSIQYVKQKEDEIEIISKMPFRNYLLQYVVPTLNEGLLEVANFLPDDPVDFLAEYLFKKSYDLDGN